MSKTRSFGKAAMDDLVDRSRYYLGTGETEMIEADYLVDALEHYRRVYEVTLREREAIEDTARRISIWEVIQQP